MSKDHQWLTLLIENNGLTFYQTNNADRIVENLKKESPFGINVVDFFKCDIDTISEVWEMLKAEPYKHSDDTALEILHRALGKDYCGFSEEELVELYRSSTVISNFIIDRYMAHADQHGHIGILKELFGDNFDV